MSSFTNRFHAAQDRACKLFGELQGYSRNLMRDQSSDDKDVCAAGVVAAVHIQYAAERLQAAVKMLRNSSHMPVTLCADDYERFLERCMVVADSHGVSSDKVADGLVHQAELALKHAEEAIETGAGFYNGTGMTFKR